MDAITGTAHQQREPSISAMEALRCFVTGADVDISVRDGGRNVLGVCILDNEEQPRVLLNDRVVSTALMLPVLTFALAHRELYTCGIFLCLSADISDDEMYAWMLASEHAISLRQSCLEALPSWSTVNEMYLPSLFTDIAQACRDFGAASSQAADAVVAWSSLFVALSGGL